VSGLTADISCGAAGFLQLDGRFADKADIVPRKSDGWSRPKAVVGMFCIERLLSAPETADAEPIIWKI